MLIALQASLFVIKIVTLVKLAQVVKFTTVLLKHVFNVQQITLQIANQDKFVRTILVQMFTLVLSQITK